MNKQRGFTLIELVVAMGVFLSLFLIVIVNFRSGESINELRLETQKIASDIRKIQTLSLTGSNYNGVSIGIGGYGIMFRRNTFDYIFFNDVNADGIFVEPDPNNPQPNDDIKLETRSLVPNINGLTTDPAYDELHIVFKPYSSNVSIYGINDGSPAELQSEMVSMYMTHSRATNKEGIVSITPVSGKIDFELQ
ncbi:prepilin-type N-terminal cleavage/methylation domain-containing protein [Patescibacteria group bacterium]|nr:prepilin-type N-terminal cleavage/methylation domain-containing protein [Patescibacteria group bacterium]